MKPILCILSLLLLAPGPAAGDSQQEPIPGLKIKVEQLYLNYHELAAVYAGMHDWANVVLDDDQELDYTQKVALFTNEAKMICYYQWRLLSIVEYIRPDALKDYFTLRLKDLARAKSDCEQTVRLLSLYAGFVDQEGLQKSIAAAVVLIRGNIYIFDRLSEILTGQTAASH